MWLRRKNLILTKEVFSCFPAFVTDFYRSGLWKKAMLANVTNEPCESTLA
jgi:hypothetical protein